MAKKLRINITIDEELLKKAKKKLGMFGGKLSTMFNAYLVEFVKSAEKAPNAEHDKFIEKIKELEDRIKKLEGK